MEIQTWYSPSNLRKKKTWQLNWALEYSDSSNILWKKEQRNVYVCLIWLKTFKNFLCYRNSVISTLFIFIFPNIKEEKTRGEMPIILIFFLRLDEAMTLYCISEYQYKGNEECRYCHPLFFGKEKERKRENREFPWFMDDHLSSPIFCVIGLYIKP